MESLMNINELANYLRVTKKTIYRLLERREIPATRIGHQWRFERVSIDNWIRQKSVCIGANVLVIDDEPAICELFSEILGRLGHTVFLAKDGVQGLEIVKKRKIDLVFLDLKMPGMDGAELLHEIRNILPTLPVVIITGYPNSDLMARALAQGPFGIIKKPFSEIDILTAVDSFLYAGEVGRRNKTVRNI